MIFTKPGSGQTYRELTRFLFIPRQSLHAKYFPYQLESCHAALDLFGNSGEQMDTEQFRCVADFTRCAKKRFLF